MTATAWLIGASVPELAGLAALANALGLDITKALLHTQPGSLLPADWSVPPNTLLLLPHAWVGLAAQMAIVCQLPLVPNVESATPDGQLACPVYGETGYVRYTLPAKGAVITCRLTGNIGAENTVAMPDATALTLTEDARVQVIQTEPVTAAGLPLDGAQVIVTGGRGLKDPANFILIEQLAQALHGAVGATRAVVDAGWRPHHEQVGQTGKTVIPRLYIAAGVSGAIQHLVGMQNSQRIVAINPDADAPIHKVADFSIIADAQEILPALIGLIKSTH
jgi:electron transfer flavoprotein alpha subunit